MKDIIRGLNENSNKVEVDTSLGVIFVECNKQLKDVYDYSGILYINFEDIPLKATKSYDDFISWMIPYFSNLEKYLYKFEEECKNGN